MLQAQPCDRSTDAVDLHEGIMGRDQYLTGRSKSFPITVELKQDAHTLHDAKASGDSRRQFWKRFSIRHRW